MCGTYLDPDSNKLKIMTFLSFEKCINWQDNEIKKLKLCLGVNYYYSYVFLKDSLDFRVHIEIFSCDLISHVCVYACSDAQSCAILYNLLDCSPPGFPGHVIFPARILEWVVISSSGDIPDPGIEHVSPIFPALEVDSLPLSHLRSLNWYYS